MTARRTHSKEESTQCFTAFWKSTSKFHVVFDDDAGGVRLVLFCQFFPQQVVRRETGALAVRQRRPENVREKFVVIGEGFMLAGFRVHGVEKSDFARIAGSFEPFAFFSHLRASSFRAFQGNHINVRIFDSFVVHSGNFEKSISFTSSSYRTHLVVDRS